LAWAFAPYGSKPVTGSIQRQPNPLVRGAFPLLLIFLVAIFSAFMELVPGAAKVRPQLIMAVFGLLVVLGTGQFMKVLNTPIGRCIAIFIAWFIACIPFGAWPGGSFAVFAEVFSKSALIYFLTAGLLTTLSQANRLYRAIAYSVGFLGVVTLLKNNRDIAGRLMLDNTRYSNANDLAWTLLVGLTFVGFLYLRGTRFQKVVALLMLPPILLAISRTGSRAAAMGVLILIVVIFAQAKRTTKIRLVVGVPVVLLVLVYLMPADMRMRFTTYFGEYRQYDYDPSNAAEMLRMSTIQSSESRRALLIDSLIITMHHPLMGVGPGNFAVAQDVLAKARGERSSWHVSHNTYTQISSEMGVPGLLIFLAVLFNVFKVLNSISRTRYPGPTWQNLRMLARTLRAGFIVFLPVAFFGSLGYNAEVPILAGIATSLGYMAQKQRAIDRTASAQTVPAEPLLEPGFEPVAVGQY
jgi:O-antigen ligase